MVQQKDHFPAFADKMAEKGLPRVVIDTFADYYRQVLSGETGLLSDRDIEPVAPDELVSADTLDAFQDAGSQALDRTVMIKLNGGLGTSMGLTTAKSLLEVKPGKTFLSVILTQAERSGVALALMNSFSTDADTAAALERLKPKRPPRMFLQHMFPKILRSDLSPARSLADPGLEWNPPGHGDIYTALQTSGLLASLLREGRRYAFISNSDNLGATLDPCLLGYFVKNRFPFMMEVAERTPSDTKGGHLARHKNGQLILREVAQCPKEELRAFTDITYYRFFNTNNIWIDLAFLADLFKARGAVPLPIILNPKTLDPRNESSPPVYQIETAMGAAISSFSGATAVLVPKSRLIPVKKCNDLLVLRSDLVLLDEGDVPRMNPERRGDRVTVELDPRFYGKIDGFNERFSAGAPSLLHCQSLSVRGNVFFEANVTIKGATTIAGPESGEAAFAPADSVISGDLQL